MADNKTNVVDQMLPASIQEARRMGARMEKLETFLREAPLDVQQDFTVLMRAVKRHVDLEVSKSRRRAGFFQR